MLAEERQQLFPPEQALFLGMTGDNLSKTVKSSGTPEVWQPMFSICYRVGKKVAKEIVLSLPNGGLKSNYHGGNIKWM